MYLSIIILIAINPTITYKEKRLLIAENFPIIYIEKNQTQYHILQFLCYQPQCSHFFPIAYNLSNICKPKY